MQENNEGTRHSDYLNFELALGTGQGQEYSVVVQRSPAGEARETMRFPYGELALEGQLKDLQIALLRSASTTRQMPSVEEQTVQDFGSRLFDALISGEVRSRYDVSLREAIQQDKGLRLKLRIQSPALATLPWEFMYDSRQQEYVCLSRSTPIVRYIELPQPVQPLTVTPPLRILCMIAAPPELGTLDVTREKGRIERATQALRAQDLIELTWIEGQTWHDLQQAMWNGPWHVFHFIGHGGFDRNADEGFIALTGEDGRAHELKATQLGRLLADYRSLRLVLLNACEGARGGERDLFSSSAAILVRRGIPAVVAMQYAISDQAAIEFAQAFYGALAACKPVDEATVEARKAISLATSNTVEWGTPALYMRSPDGVLFDVQRDAAAAQPVQRAGAKKPEGADPTTGHSGFRGWPPLAWAGLVVGLLLLAGVFAVTLGGMGRTPPAASTATALARLATATPVAMPSATVAQAPTHTLAATALPTATPTLTPLPSPTPAFGAGCLSQYFAGMDRERLASVEVGVDATVELLPGDTGRDIVGPLGIQLTENGQAIGGLQYLFFPESKSFKFTSAVDANCKPIENYANYLKSSKGSALENWDVLEIHLATGSYGIKMSWTGFPIKISPKRF